MTGCICHPAKKKCYAIMWSCGEICVGCGCCGKPSSERDKARLEYWQEELDRHINFKWWADDTELRAIQEKNNESGKIYCKRRVNYYKQKVNGGNQ